jgi:hypothetical protein
MAILEYKNYPRMDFGLLGIPDKYDINAFVEISTEGDKPLKTKI